MLRTKKAAPLTWHGQRVLLPIVNDDNNDGFAGSDLTKYAGFLRGFSGNNKIHVA